MSETYGRVIGPHEQLKSVALKRVDPGSTGDAREAIAAYISANPCAPTVDVVAHFLSLTQRRAHAAFAKLETEVGE